MKKGFTLLMVLCLLQQAHAGRAKDIGELHEARTCFDVTHYLIRIQVLPLQKSVQGSNRMRFKMRETAHIIQLDLTSNMEISLILFKQAPVQFKRKKHKFFLHFKQPLQKDSIYEVEVFYSGKPQIAKLPPWQGGFVWAQDRNNQDWIGLACESLGSSAWLPCKDHWSDEADSMDLFLEVPEGLIGVSNGRLIATQKTDSQTAIFHWAVKNPINNYNISINVGNYTEIRDSFAGLNGRLDLTYYVLNYNSIQAEDHFKQVHEMLKAFEHYFGPYPFYRNSYKLVETPYWGMEHQSCIAYGNNYKNNNFGFDFIIIHESGHEWFANSITASDAADMWIHESFTTYAEALFLEFTRNRTVADEYILAQKELIQNRSAIQGKRHQFYHDWKDSDMYYKGTWILHTMRSALHNDSLWFSALKRMNETFYHQIIGTEDVMGFFNRETHVNWDLFFKQYLENKTIPVLKIRTSPLPHGRIEYRLTIEKSIKSFSLPLHVVWKNNLEVNTLLSQEEVILILPSDFPLIDLIQRGYLLKCDYK